MKKTFFTFFAVLLLITTAQAQYDVHVGDVLCTDGSTVKAANYESSGKTACGVVFYVDPTGQHGWAVKLTQSASTFKWSSSLTDISTLPNLTTRDAAMADTAGYGNTKKIRAAGNASLYPAAWSVDSVNGWYLPAAGQLHKLFAAANMVNNTLTTLQSAGVSITRFTGNVYWSSSEYSGTYAWVVTYNGYLSLTNGSKTYNGYVREVMSFTLPAQTLRYKIGDRITQNGQTGVLCYIADDNHTGWMVDMSDRPSTYPWGTATAVSGLSNIAEPTDYTWHAWLPVTADTSGYANTLAMRGSNCPAAYAVDFANGWYLPTTGQMIWLAAYLPEMVAAGANTLNTGGTYWTSTQNTNAKGWAMNGYYCYYQTSSKTESYSVRPIKNVTFGDIRINVAVNDAAMGTAICENPNRAKLANDKGGWYYAGDNITLTATPNPGCYFVKWSDGNTQNPRQVVVGAAATYTAIFTLPPVHVGDVLCTDGSTVKAANYAGSGKTARGVVFYVDTTGQHGWAVKLTQSDILFKWSSSNTDIVSLPNLTTRDAALADTAGYGNTKKIRAAGNASLYPAAWSVDSVNGWYLPAEGQLHKLFAAANTVNNTLTTLQSAGVSITRFTGNVYWSSSESSDDNAWLVYSDGSLYYYSKDYNYYVREVMSFTLPAQTLRYKIGDRITQNGQTGVLCYIADDNHTGWMVDMSDRPSTYQWGPATAVSGLSNIAQPTAYTWNAWLPVTADTSGYANTQAMRGANCPAAYAVDFANGWYLPSAGQMRWLMAYLPEMVAAGANTLNTGYWTSSQNTADNGWAMSGGSCYYQTYSKTSQYYVRQVKNVTFGDIRINVAVNNAAMGTAGSSILGGTTTIGGSLYYAGDNITLTATPNPGCYFVKWSDGNTQNPRQVVVGAAATYTAILASDHSVKPQNRNVAWKAKYESLGVSFTATDSIYQVNYPSAFNVQAARNRGLVAEDGNGKERIYLTIAYNTEANNFTYVKPQGAVAAIALNGTNIDTAVNRNYGYTTGTENKYIVSIPISDPITSASVVPAKSFIRIDSLYWGHSSSSCTTLSAHKITGTAHTDTTCVAVGRLSEVTDGASGVELNTTVCGVASYQYNPANYRSWPVQTYPVGGEVYADLLVSRPNTAIANVYDTRTGNFNKLQNVSNQYTTEGFLTYYPLGTCSSYADKDYTFYTTSENFPASGTYYALWFNADSALVSVETFKVTRAAAPQYIVTFNYNDGGLTCTTSATYRDTTVVFDRKIRRPADPFKCGMVFMDWHLGTDSFPSIRFDTTHIRGSFTLDAFWKDYLTLSNPHDTAVIANYGMCTIPTRDYVTNPPAYVYTYNKDYLGKTYIEYISESGKGNQPCYDATVNPYDYGTTTGGALSTRVSVVSTTLNVGETSQITWSITDYCNAVRTITQNVKVKFPPCGTDNFAVTSADYDVTANDYTSYTTPYTVTYDGHTYGTVRMGCACWTAENLQNRTNSIGNATHGKPYYYYDGFSDTTANQAQFGLLYTWNDASAATGTTLTGNGESRQIGICPAGWYFPEVSDWDLIKNAYTTYSIMSNAQANYWLGEGNATNTSGFGAVPGGYYNATDGLFYNILGEAYYWTETHTGISAECAKLGFHCPEITVEEHYIQNAYSVRCVKDKEIVH